MKGAGKKLSCTLEGVVKIHFPLYERSFRRLQNDRPRQYLRPDIGRRPIILNPLENLSHLEGKQFLNTLLDSIVDWIDRQILKSEDTTLFHPLQLQQ